MCAFLRGGESNARDQPRVTPALRRTQSSTRAQERARGADLPELGLASLRAFSFCSCETFTIPSQDPCTIQQFTTAPRPVASSASSLSSRETV